MNSQINLIYNYLIYNTKSYLCAYFKFWLYYTQINSLLEDTINYIKIFKHIQKNKLLKIFKHIQKN